VTFAGAGCGGSLEGSVEVGLGDMRSGKARLVAQRFDLEFLALLMPRSGLGVRNGILDADLSLDGSFASPHASGSLKLSGAEARATEMLETFHDAQVEHSDPEPIARTPVDGALASRTPTLRSHQAASPLSEATNASALLGRRNAA
jgi:hypothetical protein